MSVLDASVPIEYLTGDPATETSDEATGADEERWVMPPPAPAEVLVGVGVGNRPSGDIDRTLAAQSWGTVDDIDEALSTEAARIADETGLRGLP